MTTYHNMSIRKPKLRRWVSIEKKHYFKWKRTFNMHTNKIYWVTVIIPSTSNMPRVRIYKTIIL
jgi:hypothetical protein